MRGFLASSIGVTCAAALALPLAPPAAGTAAGPVPTAEAPAIPTGAGRSPYVPGGTQSLPLEPLPRDRAPGADEQGLPRRDVRRFSLVGVVWDEPGTELHGRVQVRTRAVGTGAWSAWQDLETHHADHGADPGTAEGASGRVRGATAPLWVGESDGVEVRVRAEGASGAVTRAAGAPATGSLPSGLRLELVDPGRETAAPPRDGTSDSSRPGTPGVQAAGSVTASAANAGLAPLGATEIPALSRAQTESELLALAAGQQQRAKPYIGPRPRIVTRRGWGADEKLRGKKFAYTKKVKAAFVHHTASGNTYRCSQAPSVIRSIYRYHVRSMGWRDIGYNFLVDKCGKIYEGRAGGVAKPVLGAHTLGFNSNSTGIAVLGTYSSTKPSSSAVKAVARLTAWKLGLHGMNPRGKTYLKSAGGNLYRKGKNVRLNVISGHRDGFVTECPGRKLYDKLGTARSTAARYQGR
ncbi:peptidoglycan recognition protein family protein [Streptomyces sp. enrichment culture]|uniref:peptidoglycan recognition protein family protein n=1 Tax=Streptomyces sp. enrichment culture TaxID=1795815 RepID=UPI003F577A5E